MGHLGGCDPELRPRLGHLLGYDHLPGIPIPSDEAFITQVEQGKPAGEAGLEPGDRLVSIDGVDIADWDGAVKTIHGSAGVPLELVWEAGR
ncbi:MAG: PDZ domain-containing protein [Candidatus Eisenbacteria bacterium]